MPFDHHMINGKIALHDLHVVDTLDYIWLGPESNVGCMAASKQVY